MSDLSSSSLLNSSSEPELAAGIINSDSSEAVLAGIECSAAAAKDSAVAKKTPSALVDWDYKGRVVRSRFSDGHLVQFRYDDAGDLYGLVYARLAWSTSNGRTWTAQDSANTYVTDGRITANIDGSISIQREGLNRTLKLDGTICDDYGGGQVLETLRAHNDHKPADLLAEARKKNGVVTTQDFDVPSWLRPESEKRVIERSFSSSEGALEKLEKAGLHHHQPVQIQSAEAVSPALDGTGTDSGKDSAFHTAAATGLETDKRPQVALNASGISESNKGAISLLHSASIQFNVEPAPHCAEDIKPAGAVCAAKDVNGPDLNASPCGDEGNSQAAMPNGRRPLAVGKRVNRLRVLDEETTQSAATTTAPTSATDSMRLVYAQVRLAALEKLNGTSHLSLAGCLDTMAEIYLKRRRVNDAREAHERALRIRREHLGCNHSDTSINLIGLGRIFHEWGRYTEAEDKYAQAIRISGQGLQKARFMRESGLTDDMHILQHIDRLFTTLLLLSTLYSEQKRRHLCMELLSTATNIQNSLDSCYHEHLQRIISALTELASTERVSDEPAAAYMRKARTASPLGA